MSILEKKLMNCLSSNENEFVIFIFHGVIDSNSYQIRNYTKKHIYKNEFVEILNILTNKGNGISIEEMMYCLNNKKKFPKFSYVMTFDDGFENNYSVAAPILESYKVPSIFYISTDFVENNSMSWIDKIEYGLEISNKGKVKLSWEDSESYFFDIKSKVGILKKIRNHVKSNTSFDINKFVSDIYEQLKINEINSLETNLDKKLSWKQIIDLNNNEYFQVGGHSHNHLSLTSFNEKDLNFQINKSISLFKEKAKIDLQYYSYPEGQTVDFNDLVIQKLKNNGIRCCPAATHGINNLSSDPFRLHRIFL